MSQRSNFTTGEKWENLVGYSRAVRIGQSIEVSGTVSIRDGEVIGEGDAYLQTKRILEIISDAVTTLGGTMHDVIRTRIYVTDISNWEAIGRAHGEIFADIKPATTMVEVNKLIDDKFLVEIEASASIHP
jgi:enamine deaminase RidA (YjgF/YER057c/UK114 family)